MLNFEIRGVFSTYRVPHFGLASLPVLQPEWLPYWRGLEVCSWTSNALLAATLTGLYLRDTEGGEDDNSEQQKMHNPNSGPQVNW